MREETRQNFPFKLTAIEWLAVMWTFIAAEERELAASGRAYDRHADVRVRWMGQWIEIREGVNLLFVPLSNPAQVTTPLQVAFLNFCRL